jgi:hypothetical protein
MRRSGSGEFERWNRELWHGGVFGLGIMGVGNLILDLRFQVTLCSQIYTKSLLEGERGRKGEGEKTETQSIRDYEVICMNPYLTILCGGYGISDSDHDNLGKKEKKKEEKNSR